MRVTKAIREYIEQEVRKRVRAKYADDLALEKEQAKYTQDMKNACEQAALDAYFAKAAELKKEFTEVVSKEEWSKRNRLSAYGAIDFCLGHPSAERKAGDEARAAIQNIVVELELGGDKAKLMELLENI